jgi:hypothetical protein
MVPLFRPGESQSSGYTPWPGYTDGGMMSAPAIRPVRVPRMLNLMPLLYTP